MSSFIKLNVDTELNPTVNIEMPTGNHDIDSVLENLIKPALLASGFMQVTVDRIVVLEQS